MGGEDENKTVLDSGEKYDPESNTWSPVPTMHQVGSPVKFEAGQLIGLRPRGHARAGQVTPRPLGVSNAAAHGKVVALLSS